MTTTVQTVVRLIDKNKAVAAFLAPLVTAVGAALASWIVTGDFNETETRTAVAGVVLAAVSGISTYLTRAGTADPPPARATRAAVYGEDIRVVLRKVL
jgi:hypothetical protein